jgi:single-stranded DNA-specific DHH superfamily exonuclease
MSKMKDLYQEATEPNAEQYAEYLAHEEEQRDKLRAEGRAELKAELVADLEQKLRSYSSAATYDQIWAAAILWVITYLEDTK